MLKDKKKTDQDSFHKTVQKPSSAGKRKKVRKDMPIDQLLLWVYQTQCAAAIIGRGVGMYGPEKDADNILYKNISGDGVYAIQRNAMLGVRVDHSGWASADIHPDAELVHDLIVGRGFTPLERGLLISYGESGVVPDWLPGVRPMVVGKFRANGKPVMVYDDSKKRKPVACVLEVVNSVEHIEYCRAVYARWYEAMEKLCGMLWSADVVVTSFNVEKPSMKKEPWRS